MTAERMANKVASGSSGKLLKSPRAPVNKSNAIRCEQRLTGPLKVCKFPESPRKVTVCVSHSRPGNETAAGKRKSFAHDLFLSAPFLSLCSFLTSCFVLSLRSIL